MYNIPLWLLQHIIFVIGLVHMYVFIYCSCLLGGHVVEAEKVRHIISLVLINYSHQVLKHSATISSDGLQDPKAHMSSGTHYTTPQVKLFQCYGSQV